MRINCRGQMGVQFLEAAVGISNLNDDEEPILVVNSGGNLPYDGTNKLDILFEPQCRVIDIDDGFRKTPYWVDGAATRIFENREKIFRWLKPKDYSLHPSEDANTIHIRTGDKQAVSKESYEYLISLAPKNAVVYSNDIEFAKTLSDRVITGGSVFEDWCRLYNSYEVYAAPSAFIMMMLIINPEKRVKFIGEPHLIFENSPSDMLFIREAMEFCPNVEILS